MNSILNRLRSVFTAISLRSRRTWKKYRALKPWIQAVIAAIILSLLIGAVALARGGNAEEASSEERTVTVESVGSLSGNAVGSSALGTVRSVTQADLLAQNGGTVRSVNTTLGARVPAGFVIASLDSASEAAAVLQAEGAYDSAIAARNIITLQSSGTQTSFAEAQRSARDSYRSAFTATDTTLESDVDLFFGTPTATGPSVKLIGSTPRETLSRGRKALDDRIDAWRANLDTANSQDPATLLAQAVRDVQAVSDFLVQLSDAANKRDSGATPEQLAGLARARAAIDGQLAALSAARDAYNAKKTAASVAGTSRSSEGTQLASANASVKSALGSLRAAQAQFEKTRIRATIGGTVNFLPIKVGQYVNAFERVATIANNGALEIVAYVPEEARTMVGVGMTVTVEGDHEGTITAVSPALDPITKQIEVRVAVDATPDLVNGQSVRITLPSEIGEPQTTATSTPTQNTRILLPLSAVKLLPTSRAVFRVGEDGRIVAHTVEIGDVVSDRIEVTSGISADMRIITDVRGLSEGQKVKIEGASE